MGSGSVERIPSMTSLQPVEFAGGGERASNGAPSHDVDPRQYATVIREMIRHENEVTNHRIMWLLVVQGLIANAYVGAGLQSRDRMPVLPILGILVTLSAFVLLYKS